MRLPRASPHQSLQLSLPPRIPTGGGGHGQRPHQPGEVKPGGAEYYRKVNRALLRLRKAPERVLRHSSGHLATGTEQVSFISEDRVRDVIHNFNADGFGSLYPRYSGGRPPKFTLPQRREIQVVARANVA